MSIMGKDLIRAFEFLTLKRKRYDPSLDRQRSLKRKVESCSQDTMSVTSNNLIRAVERLTLKKRRYSSAVVDGQRSLKRRRKIESTTSSLPHDTIYEILTKLPVKSILRFKSVCRSWDQIITDPYFVRLQLNEARRKPPRTLVLQTSPHFQPRKKFGLYALEEESLLPEPMFEREFPGEESMIMSACHCDGLILLYSRTNIYLCNPSTREILSLPKFSPGKTIHEHTVQYIGFGLDRSTNKYKVVRMFYRHYSELTLEYSVGCEVFTPGMDSWRQVDDSPCPPFQKHSASTNGIVYWMTKHCQYDHNIISFDLSNEEFRTVRLPPDALVIFAGKKKIMYLMEGYGGERLWLVRLYWHPSTALHIWELEDRMTHSWTKMRTIGWQFSDSACIPLPMLALSGGRRLMVMGDRKKVDCYDIESEETTVKLPVPVPKKDEVGIGALEYDICLCIESLAPLAATAAGDLYLYWNSHSTGMSFSK